MKRYERISMLAAIIIMAIAFLSACASGSKSPPKQDVEATCTKVATVISGTTSGAAYDSAYANCLHDRGF